MLRGVAIPLLSTVGIIDVKKEGFIQYVLSQLGDLASVTRVIFDDDLSIGWIYFQLHVDISEIPWVSDASNRDLIMRIVDTIVGAFPDVKIKGLRFDEEDNEFALWCGMATPRDADLALAVIEGSA